ncbi:MAG: hypothetical protein LBV63_00595 [Candidatus Methanoplasma sp.]|jgi:ABC-type nitrate/sulfonate/bicarbonate transport system substrate-binding protein|nr:hypothetical protein [Candidatus Methanoplasma sp.]
MANLKIIAIVVVVVLIVAGAGVFLLTRDNEQRSEEINLVTGLEAVGSGIYYNVNKVNPDNLLTVDKDGKVTYHPAGWNKLVFGSPGTASIQHIQLKTIVEVYLNDKTKIGATDTPKEYRLVAYTDGQTAKDGEIYFVNFNGGGAALPTSDTNKAILDAGLTWQPQLVKVVADPAYGLLVRTNELFPHQTCCVTIANQSYISANPEIAERVVWALVKATDWVNAAEAKGAVNPNDPDYLRLLQIGASVAGPNFTTDELKLAFADVEYDWGDVDASGNPIYTNSNPLGKLKSDVALQTDDIIKTGATRGNVTDLGFKNSTEYANELVDDSILKSVLSKGINNKPTYDSRANVRFILINGDIHQLPVHIANEIGFFDQVGIDITKVGVSIGSAVITGLKANEADFGVSGQPSIIIDNINNKLTKA